MTDEIKLTIDTLRYCEESGARCGECPSGVDEKGIPRCHSQAHIADLIESLASELEQVKLERDEALEHVKVLGACAYCRHDSFCKSTIPDCMNCKDESCPCYTCGHQSKWQWCGAKEGE